MADPSMAWTHPPSFLWGAVYPSSHMVEAPTYVWGGEAGFLHQVPHE